MSNKIFKGLALILIFLLMLTIPATASPRFTLDVCPSDLKGQAVEDLYVRCCKIASLEEGAFTVEAPFKGVSLTALMQDPQAASQLYAQCIADQKIPARQGITVEGSAFFADLEAGLWLVWCPEGQSYRFNPFVVRFGEQGDAIVSRPKAEQDTPESKSVQVIKKWDDANNAAGKRPQAIQIDLLEDGQAIARVELSEANGWSYTFSGLSKERAYTVYEYPVAGYTAKIGGSEADGFIITNSYVSSKLPQTGQLWWPIGLMALAGIALVVLGLNEMKERKSHGA